MARNATRQFLVRDAKGRMKTIMSTSVRAAAKDYVNKYRPKRGDFFSVKERGTGDWADYEAT